MSKRLLIIVLLGVLAIAGALAFWKWTADPEPQALAPAQGGRPRLTVIRPARTLVGHDDGVHRVAFSPDGSLLLTASHDGTARLWRVANGEEVQRLEAHEGAVQDACFSPDGRRVATCGFEGRVMAWDVQDGSLLAMMSGGGGTAAWRVVFLPDGSILSSHSDGVLRRWDVEREAMTGALRGHRRSVRALALSRDGRRAVSGGDDGQLIMWDLESGRSVWQAEWSQAPGGGSGSPAAVWDLCFSPDDAIVYGAALGRTGQAWEAATGRHARTLGGAGNARTVAALPGGKRLLVGGDESAGLYDAQSTRLESPLLPDDRMIHSVAVSPDGRWAAMGRGGVNTQQFGWIRATDATVPIWELPPAQP
jgi:WD40 repeat protein